MVLACFICNKAFDDRLDREYCYDNYMYNNIKTRQVSDFEAHDITAKLGIIYARTMEYPNLFFFNECKRLLAVNPRGPQTIVDQTCACKKALNNFALQT